MNRTTLLFLLLVLGLLGGAAWLLLGVSGDRDGGLSENPFAFDEEEDADFIAPGAALDEGHVERAGLRSEEEAGAAAAAAAATGPQNFEKSTLRGRHLDAQGFPLIELPLHLLEIGGKFGADSKISKDKLGVFLAPLRQPEELAAPSWLCLQPRGPDAKQQLAGAQDTWVFARAVDPVTKVQDVGDLVAGSGSTALAGIVTDLDRRPLAGAQVEVVWYPGGGTRSSGVFLAHTGADGRFQFLGSWPDLGKWIVRGSHPEFLDATLQVAPGATNVELLLPRGSALRGKILVDPEISLERLTVRIRARSDGSKKMNKWEVTRNLQPDPKTGEFAVTGLPSGWGRIRVYDRQMKWNLYFQYGIPLPAGFDAQVPKLQPLDLRGRLKNFQLTALQPNGSLAEDLKIVVHGEKRTRSFGIPNPLACVVPSETISITVTAKGCLEQAVFISGKEQTIRLEASPRVTFILLNPPRLDADGELSASVQRIEGTKDHWTLEFNENGTAELELPPGSYAVVAQVGLRSGRSVDFGPPIPFLPDGKPRQDFVVGPAGVSGPIRIQLDAAAALERLSALRNKKPR